MRRWGLKVRLIFWHGAALTVALLALCVAADRLLARSVRQQVDTALRALAEPKRPRPWTVPPGSTCILTRTPAPVPTGHRCAGSIAWSKSSMRRARCWRDANVSGTRYCPRR